MPNKRKDLLIAEDTNRQRNPENLAKLDRSFDQLYAGKGHEHELIED